MKRAVFAVAVVLICAPITHAALTDNGGNLVYGTEQNITWYDSARAPMSGSPATFRAADQPVGGITAGDRSIPSVVGGITAGDWNLLWAVGGTTAGDWSFPWASDASLGSVTEAERGHLYWDDPADSAGRPHDDKGHFAPNWFWTGAAPTPNWFWTGAGYASRWDRPWEFGAGGFWNEGNRDWYLFHGGHYRHDENNTTPMPTAALLFGPCFIGLAAIRRRFKK